MLSRVRFSIRSTSSLSTFLFLKESSFLDVLTLLSLVDIKLLDDILAIRSRGKLIFVGNEFLKDTVAQVAIFQEIEYGFKDVVSVRILAHVNDTILVMAVVIGARALW